MNALATTDALVRIPGGAARSGRPASDPIPTISPWLLQWFSVYTRRHLRRHFHAIRLSRHSPLPQPGADVPVILYLNHASWWDPLVCLELKNRFFADRTGYAPIDAAMLKKYRFFRRLGFFGVEQKSMRGALQFLRLAQQILIRPNTLLALTPQGRFADVRERPINFQSGIGHLANRIDRAVFVPMALEYGFWHERLPEVLVRFGEPVRTIDASRTPREWTAILEQKLGEAQDTLAAQAQRRNDNDFQVLLRGRSGAAPIYDLWRAARERFRGRKFSPEHGTL